MANSNTSECFHCGLAIDGAPQWFADIDGRSQPMCCVGCQAVAEAITADGLDNYYKFRSETARQGHTPADYHRYDSDAFFQEFVTRHDDGRCSIRLIIEDIHCAACVWLIEQRLQRLKGLQAIEVSLSDHTARVHWQADQLKLSDIFSTIDGIGYSPHPYNPDTQQALFKQASRSALRRVGLAGIVMMQVGMFSIALYAGGFMGIDSEHQHFIRWFCALLTLPVIGYCALPFFKGALRALSQHSVNMDVPVSIALTGAFVASIHGTVINTGEVYYDSIAMFTFFLLVARYLELRSRHQQSALNHQSFIPKTCRRLSAHQQHEEIAVRDLNPGDHIFVRPGETIPADGVVIDGAAAIDESSFSGEFLPLTRRSGDSVMAGTIATDGSLTIEVSATGEQTSFSVIQRLLSQAQQDKPYTARLADTVARYFTGLVLAATTVAGISWSFYQPEHVFYVCFAMLVVSCPCALSLATPTALTVATTALRRSGILLSKSHVLETAPLISHIVFDKTGTLTKGKLALHHQQPLSNQSGEQCLAIAAALEIHSEHPIAKVFTDRANHVDPASQVSIATGFGIEGTIAGRRYRIGSRNYCRRWLAEIASGDQPRSERQSVYLASESEWLCRFDLSDELRDDSASAIAALKQAGYRLSLLTGDSSGAATALANQLGFDHCEYGLSPADKLDKLRALRHGGERILMIGDGINDIPVLASADISIAMNNASDLAKIQADAALLGNQLAVIPGLLRQARRTRAIIRQNLGWALAYNLTTLPLAAIGLIPPYLAAAGMSLSSLLVILNANRLQRIPDQASQQQRDCYRQPSAIPARQ